MARLSNFLRRHDDDERDDDGADGPATLPPTCRPARTDELDAALRLLLAGPNGLASDEQVLEFLAFSDQRAVEVRSIWVAARSVAGSTASRIEWALLPVVSPGRAVLLLTPTRLLRPRQTPNPSVRALSVEVCAQYARQGVQLAQLLLDPVELPLRDAYVAAGFAQLAELIYLSRSVKHAASHDELLLPQGFELIRYHPDDARTRDLFARTITASYQGSLDCPGLNGMRDVADVLAGHQAAGDFDPNRWFVLTEYGQPRAVLLFNRSLNVDALELVYLGLIPEARGRGLGEWMMRLAMACVTEAKCAELTLAVDSRNAPALNLYHRHGMQRVTSRLAMIRDLRKLA